MGHDLRRAASLNPPPDLHLGFAGEVRLAKQRSQFIDGLAELEVTERCQAWGYLPAAHTAASARATRRGMVDRNECAEYYPSGASRPRLAALRSPILREDERIDISEKVGKKFWKRYYANSPFVTRSEIIQDARNCVIEFPGEKHAGGLRRSIWNRLLREFTDRLEQYLHEEPIELNQDGEELHTPSLVDWQRPERATMRVDLDVLDSRERHVINLRYWENLTQDEVAAELCLHQSTVHRIEEGALQKLGKNKFAVAA